MANLIVGNDGSNTLQGTTGTDVIYGYDPNGPQSDASSIAATRVASGLTQPVFAGAAPGDTGRLFIVEKTGLIKILDLGTGQVLATPFLDVSSQILSDGERGLLGLAFDPNYASNGLFYIYLINSSGNTEIRSYHVSANLNAADAASATPIITVAQAPANNHKAGWIGFGPDGYLYAALGDGGGGGDTFHTGQNIVDDLLGNILRLDVHSDAFPGDATKNYAIPADNPFAGQTPGLDEIFAFGLRNPWRDSFDRALGTFYIADVGQDQWEEIDIGQNGANYGWNTFEGPAPFPGGDALTGGPAIAPIYAYDHTVGHSITGGYVYRGEGEALQGQYFFADFIQSKVFTLRFNGSSWVATERTSQIVPDVGAVNNPSSFGEDARGNLYIVDFGGEIFRLTPIGASADQGDVLSGLAGNDMLFGGSGNDTLIGGPGADTMLGGAGSDTADYSSSPAGVTVNLASGLGAGGDAQGDILGGIENLIGSAQADTLTGDSNANVMTGGAGNDTYVVDRAGDLVIENAGEGTDTVLSTAHFALPTNVENLTLLGAADLQGYGNDAANTVTGNAGSNLLDGRGGADVMLGGAGNDTYFVDNAGDQVIENAGEGTDAVFSSAHFALSANVETLVLQGSADLQGYGNDLANALYGNTGNNLLNGGAGADVMFGGLGNDVYFVDGGDGVIENANEGTDSVFSTTHYALSANVENLVLQGSADLQGYGNDLANALYGNTGNNLLNGGTGADVMFGGLGNDTYFVDGGDGVIENANEGNDTVFSTTHYALAANVENLVLQGSADLQGYGNSLNNVLYGNIGNNLLNGGTGADVMFGGAGNDVYFVDDPGDLVFENMNEGTDAVFSTVNYTLPANVENLVLQGSGNLSGAGNGLANQVYGNAGDNALDGGAGADLVNGSAGHDTLTGGTGNDIFAFNSGQADGDTLVDFTGNGSGAGDSLLFVGYGTAAQGATFTQIGATNQWQIHSSLGGLDEIITFLNGASVDPSDVQFV
jgi:Ca2+-binding RTX toxin-like protein